MVAEKVQELEQENLSLKRQVAELQSICETRTELPKNCEYCDNYIQHYFRNGNRYYPTCDGHCVAGSRTKNRKTGDTCRAFVKKVYGKNLV